MSEKMIVNPTALEQYIELLGDDGKEFILEIIDTFLKDANNQFDSLDKSLKEDDSVTFRRVSHTLKTGCAIVGADNLSKMFLDLELIAERGDLSSVEDFIVKCKNTYNILEDELLQKKKELLQ